MISEINCRNLPLNYRMMSIRILFLTVYLIGISCQARSQEQDRFHKDYLVIVDTGFCMAGYFEEFGEITFISSDKPTLDEELSGKMLVYKLLFEDFDVADCVRHFVPSCDLLPRPLLSEYYFSSERTYESKISYYRVVLTMAIETKIIDFGESNYNLISDEYLYTTNKKIRVKPFFKNSYVWPRILSMSIIDSNGEIIWTR